MNQNKQITTEYENPRVDTKIKICALWIATMFCYIYCDYFELYTPGKLAGMLAGRMEPLGPVTQGVLFGTSVMLAVPSIMIFMSLVMKPRLNRWANIVFGTAYTIITLLVLSMTGWMFYQFFAVIEVALTALIVWYAWSWPKHKST
jgi:hypothetical protein